ALAGHLPPSPSFPTRRSSDLTLEKEFRWLRTLLTEDAATRRAISDVLTSRCGENFPWASVQPPARGLALLYNFSPFQDTGATVRSEEHTSELQSRFDLVCRLL